MEEIMSPPVRGRGLKTGLCSGRRPWSRRHRLAPGLDPEWSPRYLAALGGLALPRVIADVAALISGGLAGTVAK